MKLRFIFESILNEIGDSSQIPSGAKFSISEFKGLVKFNFMSDDYTVEIRLPVKQDIGMGMTVDFFANNDQNAGMTNKGHALKIMSFVVGSIEEWIRRYYKKFGSLPIFYLKFNPKSESEETQNKDGINSRDRIYRIFIEKFAKKYNSTVIFSNVGGISAQFKPPLTIE